MWLNPISVIPSEARNLSYAFIRGRRKRIVLTLILPPLVCAISANAQEPVPLARGNAPGEPHHHLKIENEYVRVYYVEVPPHENTQLHQHDHDYIYVSLGPADVVSAILNQPEIHLQLKDGETHFTRGGFAHVARNLADTPFRNITIELLRPQGKLHNWCDNVVPDEEFDCRTRTIQGRTLRPSFRTDSIKEFEETLNPKVFSTWEVYSDALIVVLTDSQLQVSFDKKKQELDAEQVYWISSLPRLEMRKITLKNQRKGNSRYLVILFEGYAPENKSSIN